ncbi:hypothetical protein ACN47E_003346 [Coniothyrium glycines]
MASLPQSSFPCSPGTDSRPSPKNRGCFQCSRRRIICDKGEPSCNKCIKKGIECSGLNRIRFATGVARRGILKDRKIPDKKHGHESQDQLPNHVNFTSVRWKSDQKGRKKRKVEQKPQDEPQNQQVQHNASQIVFIDETPRYDPMEEEEGEKVMDIVRSTAPSVQGWIPQLSSEARMLFTYFSEAVAPVMVVLDTIPNGYRELILPMATEDDVLRRAVGVVAAQRLSRERPELKGAAEAGRTAIISRLHRESLCKPANQVFSKYTWATLIVLLVGETVTGNADYSFLVQMLLCFSMNSLANNEDSEITRFLSAQTNMFKLLGLPLLGEDSGLLAIRESFQSWTSFLSYEALPADSTERRVMETVRQCFASACAIYIRRASSKDFITRPGSLLGDDPVQQSTVHLLIDRLSNIPPQAPGAHALVWVCFIGAAESNDPIQRQFFVDYMHGIYAKTRFENIPIAVQSLQNIWANKGKKRWTQCLSELSQVLVM